MAYLRYRPYFTNRSADGKPVKRPGQGDVSRQQSQAPNSGIASASSQGVHS